MAARRYEDDYYSIYDEEDAEQIPVSGAGNRKTKRKKKRPMRRLFFLLLGCLFCLCTVVYVSGYWKTLLSEFAGDFVSDNMNSFTEEELTSTFEKPQTVPDGWQYDSRVINVLLVGIEGIGSGSAYAGRSDSMILVSFHMDTGQISLVSLLRDTYVTVPGHGGVKLNAAYAYGGLDLLIETVQNTWKIYIDGVVRVNFDEFESVIDTLGGVTITLTQEEADYLNRTNYISDKSNRVMVAGKNRMNGNQALGYCRVRKVGTMDGDKMVYSDYGRTTRQRKVLSALFESYRNYNKTKLLSVTKEILGILTCSLSEEQITACINAYLNHPAERLLQYQIPAKGYFTGETKDCGDCLVPDYEANVAILHHYLYGTALPDGITLSK